MSFLPSLPSPFAKEDGPRPHPLHHAPPHLRADRKGGAQGTPLPLPSPFLPISTKGTPEGMCTRAPATTFPLSLAPPFPFARKECAQGHTATASPQSLPFPWQKGTRCTSPSPFGHAAVYARERGARGHATPDPTLPITRKGTRPSTLPFPFAWKGRTRGARHPQCYVRPGSGH
ncbi:hypothetical protein EDB83DRAFT_2521482 [Lactarius deliciosus]|nr:hypothetical protein EDB83DRAFT_2521482 [Lactarius deliciosus]